ncbi:MAG: sigma-70 family RNA polymerase sigma factor [Bacteroidia bacterium]
MKFTDKEIIEAILAGGAKRERVVNYLFDKALFDMTHKIQAKLHLNEEEIQDAYTDSVVKLVEQIIKGNFRGESKISTYFFRILYNKSVDKLRQRPSYNGTIKHLPVEDIAHHSDPSKNILDLLEVDESRRSVRGFLHQIGTTCQQILLDFYNGYTMEEIAARTGLKNAESATSQKYKCFKKLKEIMEEAGVNP